MNPVDNTYFPNSSLVSSLCKSIRVMGKVSVTPLNHFENYRENPQKGPNFRPPLGVQYLKGIQLQAFSFRGARPMTP